jgi:hypothetical protein
MPLRRNDKVVLPLHSFLGRPVELHIEFPEHICEVEIQFGVRKIDANAGARATRECHQLILQLRSIGSEPTFWSKGFGVGEMNGVHMVAVGDAGNGHLRIVRRCE